MKVVVAVGEVLAATDAAIAAASHLTAEDQGAVAALRAVAVRVDVVDAYMQALADDAVVRGLRPPSQDNVSLPTYLKFCESLGLTPAGRERLKPKPVAEGKPSALESLRSARRSA